MEHTDDRNLIDPVCGEDVIEHAREAVGRVEWEGRPFYFCSFQCRERFEGNPDGYLYKAL